MLLSIGLLLFLRFGLFFGPHFELLFGSLFGTFFGTEFGTHFFLIFNDFGVPGGAILEKNRPESDANMAS